MLGVVVGVPDVEVLRVVVLGALADVDVAPPLALVVVRPDLAVVPVRLLVLGPEVEVSSLGMALVTGGPSVTVKRPSARLPGGPVSRTP